ncbi:MAG TPA: prolipoprotein diacylglyceryl transferase family protein [Lysobacter sp.]|jgi:prolipoprotein diacylglyceryltransferase|nr:prolipoprotein diacylglyceryl transferase family protein [Lysobacter sp.]
MSSVFAQPWWVHWVFELLAYAIGFRLYLALRRRDPDYALADRDSNLVVLVCAALGAAAGAKIAYWLYDPATAFTHFPDWRALLGGKSIVGALLGGLIGVELGKISVGIRRSTGDLIWPALLTSMLIGRIGCLFTALHDGTAGSPTSLPWGVDFGDGIARHPAPLYEIVFLAGLGILLWKRRQNFVREGDAFRAFLFSYLTFRLLLDFLKPMPTAYLSVFSGLQLLCVAGLLYYARDIPRLVRVLRR